MKKKSSAATSSGGVAAGGAAAPHHGVAKGIDLIVLVLILGLAWYAIFDLPYSYPSSILMRATSYRMGFNNQVSIFASVAVVAILTLRAFLSPWTRKQNASEILGVISPDGAAPRVGMPRSLLGFGLVVTVVLTWLFYYCIPDISSFFEAAVCLPKMELGMHYGVRPYSDVWWPYGPALYYIPIWFMEGAKWIGFTIEDGYVAACVFLLLAGVWTVFWIIDQLRIKVVYRGVLFVIISIASHIWTMGPHTIARHILPYVFILLIHRSSSRVLSDVHWRDLRQPGLHSFIGALMMLSVSPEMGVALVFGSVAYFGHRMVFRNRTWILPLGCSLAAMPVWILLFPQCFSFAGSFSAGAGCNPVVPAPHILFYLLSLFWILPLAAKDTLSGRRHAGASLLAAWVVMVVVTIPPSLSRCDSTHVVWNGVGLFILAFALVVRCWPRLLPLYSVLMLMILGVGQQFGNATALSGCFSGMRAALAGKRVQRGSEASPLVQALGLEGYSAIAAPFGMDHATRTYLLSSHKYAPQYHMDLSCIVSEADTQRVISDLKTASYLLVPEGILSFKGAGSDQVAKLKEARQTQRDEEESYALGTTYFYPFPVKSKRPGFDPEIDLAVSIANDYYPLKRSNGWVLLKPF